MRKLTVNFSLKPKQNPHCETVCEVVLWFLYFLLSFGLFWLWFFPFLQTFPFFEAQLFLPHL